MYRYLTPEDIPHTKWRPPFSWFFLRVCSREMGRRILTQPSILELSKEHLKDLLRNHSYHCSERYIHRWLDILEQGVDAVAHVLCSPDDNESQVLRSVMPIPLYELLSPDERDEIRKGVISEVKTLRKLNSEV